MKKRTRCFAIEFRNGSFFTTLEAERGGTLAQARVWPTRKAARKFADRHVWIYFNGGMIRRACSTPASRFCEAFEASHPSRRVA